MTVLSSQLTMEVHRHETPGVKTTWKPIHHCKPFQTSIGRTNGRRLTLLRFFLQTLIRQRALVRRGEWGDVLLIVRQWHGRQISKKDLATGYRKVHWDFHRPKTPLKMNHIHRYLPQTPLHPQGSWDSWVLCQQGNPHHQPHDLNLWRTFTQD